MDFSQNERNICGASPQAIWCAGDCGQGAVQDQLLSVSCRSRRNPVVPHTLPSLWAVDTPRGNLSSGIHLLLQGQRLPHKRLGAASLNYTLPHRITLIFTMSPRVPIFSESTYWLSKSKGALINALAFSSAASYLAVGFESGHIKVQLQLLCLGRCLTLALSRFTKIQEMIGSPMLSSRLNRVSDVSCGIPPIITKQLLVSRMATSSGQF